MAGSIKEKKVTRGGLYPQLARFSFSIIPHRSSQTYLQVFPRKMWEALREGQDVSFVVDAFPWAPNFVGQVKTIYPSLEEKTRSLQVEAVVANTDRSLKPGLFARVTLLHGPARDTVVVPPITALLYDNSQHQSSCVAEGNRAKEAEGPDRPEIRGVHGDCRGFKAKEIGRDRGPEQPDGRGARQCGSLIPRSRRPVLPYQGHLWPW